MVPKDKRMQANASNERFRNSSESSAHERAAAWRRQVLLMQSASSAEFSVKDNVLQQHYEKYEELSKQLLHQRTNAVKALLAGHKKRSQPLLQAADFPELDDKTFETPCRGLYESCRHDEIATKELQKLQKGSNAADDVVQPAIVHKVRQEQIPRNAMDSFLQHKKNNAEGSNNSSIESNQHRLNLPTSSDFRTAREELMLQNLKQRNSSTATITSALNSAHTGNASGTPLFNYGNTRKTLGTRRTVRSTFVPPLRATESNPGLLLTSAGGLSQSPPINCSPESNEKLANVDQKMIDIITNEIISNDPSVSWDDIAGLEYAKSIIKEAVIYPMLRPDIFTGLRRPPRGILLFGPPGTGKTLIGKCIASQSNSTFFSVSASTLTSKYVGDGEKMVRALFGVAAARQPAVVFIDEIDSLLTQRSESEHESSRRLKTEFLVQLDGAATSQEDRILIIGATNRPQELDDAARRRLVKRLYIPLPEHDARIQVVQNLLRTVQHNLSAEEIQEVGKLTAGYSCSDMKSLCEEASMEPIRSIPAEEMMHFDKDNVRPVSMLDFCTALQKVRPSVSQQDLKQYVEWNEIYGASRYMQQAT